MADQNDVRRIALSLAQTSESQDHFGFSVANNGKLKQFVWAWNERVDPKKPRVAREDVLVVRVSDLEEKDALVASDARKFFTEPHYDGFRAVLVRLAAIEEGELEELIVDAWRCQAPRELAEAFEWEGP